MPYVLGIDSGGTKTEAVLALPDGTVAGWGRWAAPESGTLDEGGRSPAAVQAAVRQAIGATAIDRLRIINTGNGFSVPQLWPQGGDTPVTLRNIKESDTIFVLAPGRAALVALAGTGSHIAGLNGRGRQIILDGIGPYIGDYGGALAIGLEGLRAAAKSGWHPRHRTSLADALSAAVRQLDGPHSDGSLPGFMYREPERWKVAALARWVNAEAEAGDGIAREILRQAGHNYAEVVYDVLERLSLRDARLPLIGFGSVITGSRLFWDDFREAVAGFAPGIRAARLCLPPAACHALSVLRAWRVHPFSRVRARLRETLAPFLGYDIPCELDYS